MLGNLVSYIFGSETEETSDGYTDRKEVTLHLRDADDDWVVIDKTEEEKHQASVELAEKISVLQAESESGMECSWYVTPPPCFTSTSGPLATDPMETLLLEHPSMSVYQTEPRSIGATHHDSTEGQDATSPPDSTNNSTPAVQPQTRTNSSVQTASRPGATAASLAARAGILQQATLIRETQKAQQFRSQRLLKRAQMNRSNKAREFAANGKRHRRRDFMKKHSGMNNNRQSC